METCFAILLGDISVNDDLKALSGLQGESSSSWRACSLPRPEGECQLGMFCAALASHALFPLSAHCPLFTHRISLHAAAAGALFFWSYEILVFLVLLNFLLAIIV